MNNKKEQISNLFECECKLENLEDSSLLINLFYNSINDSVDWSSFLNLKKLEELTKITKYDDVKLVGSEVELDSSYDYFIHSFSMICHNDL